MSQGRLPAPGMSKTLARALVGSTKFEVVTAVLSRARVRVATLYHRASSCGRFE